LLRLGDRHPTLILRARRSRGDGPRSARGRNSV